MKRRPKPLGKRTPWLWAVELTNGCNLACWHCSARLLPKSPRYRVMSKDTWVQLCHVIDQVAPHTRMEIAQCGEPTLHPNLYEYLQLARQITPTTQIQVTTNGLTLLAGKVTFRDLFEAGANSVYVDMYGHKKEHFQMAKESGAEWYKYDQPRKIGSPGHKMANTYYGDPNMRLVILQDTPEYRLRWRKSGRLSTFLNHIDWKVAMPYGLVPVRHPYARKCTMPMRFSTVNYKGEYLFCCIDFWSESGGQMGNVSEGVEGFRRYWFGLLMQSIRRRLVIADRASIPYCERCNCAFSKCDWTHIWPANSYDWWWNGSDWKPMQPMGSEQERAIFADGWERSKEITLPSAAEELRVLDASTHRIIHSVAATAKPRRA